MPLINNSTFKPPLLLRNHHLQTILPSQLRSVKGIRYKRERLELKDGDFVDLDWVKKGNENLVVVCHGLEGSAESGYVKGIIKTFQKEGWDGVAFNFRGCSGEPNRLERAYHSGATEDLEEVIQHVLPEYRKIVLIGYSLGGNLVLKYIGERGAAIEGKIIAGVAFSVPCDLATGAVKMARLSNYLYMRRFLKKLTGKVMQKKNVLPSRFLEIDYKKMRTFHEFDDAYTAPVHGFKDAVEYYRINSSRKFLQNIMIPTLLINAQDDPFLSAECFPYEEAAVSKYFYFEAPEKGGHVGFLGNDLHGEYWHEQRAREFVENIKS